MLVSPCNGMPTLSTLHRELTTHSGYLLSGYFPYINGWTNSGNLFVTTLSLSHDPHQV